MDGDLREFERAWRLSGAPGDEAAYLLERRRLGVLAPERLDLAAYCGHAGAATALAGASLCTAPGSPDTRIDYSPAPTSGDGRVTTGWN